MAKRTCVFVKPTLQSSLLGKVLLFIVILLLPINALAEIVWADIRDPNVKDALFDSYQGHHFTAITRLQSAQKQGRVLDPEKAGLVLGGLYLAYGFHEEASRIFEALLNTVQSRSVRDQAWFYLAKTRYQRGKLDEALSAVGNVKNSMNFSLRQERYILEANIFLHQQRYSDALAALKHVNEHSDWGPYAKFNKGVAVYHLGREDEGIKILDEVGSMAAGNAETQALKDKANLVLGYGYLEKDNPAAAQVFLERMKLSGPFANKALLALGRIYSDKKMHKQSLVPWLKLIERHPSAPAVQDAMMAVPFALGQLEAFKQSLEYYEKAMAVFQSEIGKIDRAAEAVSGGKMLENITQFANLELEGATEGQINKYINTPEGHYLLPLLSQYEFRETLESFIALQLSLGKLERWSASLKTYNDLPDKKRKMYEKRITRIQSKTLLVVEKFRHYLQRMAFDELERRKTRLESYFNDARFSVAQIYDYAAKRWGDGNEQ
ncbi:MAG: tetratricopeptide repeat protein [Gammaproteobacteria bacterium]|nr:tetratricopeptide repeat protein [Gammaproteobacteria bacterium]